MKTLNEETLNEETLNQETLNQETLSEETLNEETGCHWRPLRAARIVLPIGRVKKNGASEVTQAQAYTDS